MPLIIGLYAAHLYPTNYWIMCDGFLSHYILDCMLRICILLIIGLYVMDFYATNYWIVCCGFECHSLLDCM